MQRMIKNCIFQGGRTLHNEKLNNNLMMVIVVVVVATSALVLSLFLSL